MRYRVYAVLAVGASAAVGCGSGTFANKPRPPSPVNLTVYVDNTRVSVSPSSVGAGPVIFIVTNQADKTESVAIQSADGSRTLGTTGPINPQATAQVTVDFQDPGQYRVSTGKTGSTEAAQFAQSPIIAATIHIGHKRLSASNQLLQP